MYQLTVTDMSNFSTEIVKAESSYQEKLSEFTVALLFILCQGMQLLYLSVAVYLSF